MAALSTVTGIENYGLQTLEAASAASATSTSGAGGSGAAGGGAGVCTGTTQFRQHRQFTATNAARRDICGKQKLVVRITPIRKASCSLKQRNGKSLKGTALNISVYFSQ